MASSIGSDDGANEAWFDCQGGQFLASETSAKSDQDSASRGASIPESSLVSWISTWPSLSDTIASSLPVRFPTLAW